MSAATIHQLPVTRNDDDGQDHAATVEALVTELGALAVELADARAMLAAMRAAFLPRSDERDRWSALALARFGEGYRAGFDAGLEVGYGQARTDSADTDHNCSPWPTAEWSAQRSEAARQLDRRRYPPDGRLSWLRPRLADTLGAWVAWCIEQDGGE